jgi:hypothetical protein
MSQDERSRPALVCLTLNLLLIPDNFSLFRNVDFKVKLKTYPVPKALKDALAAGGAEVTKLLDSNVHGRVQILRYLQWLEEIQMERDILNYTIEGAKMSPRSGGSVLFLPIPGLAEKRPSVLRGDRVFAKQVQIFEGVVTNVERDGVCLRYSKRFHDSFINGQAYTIQFAVNKLPSRRCHQALELFSQQAREVQLVRLRPGETQAAQVTAMAPNRDMWFKRNLNERQKQAVNYIVSGYHKLAPYILFGPPGTGKTTTIIEAILQLARNDKFRILLAAPSNNAADLIVSRLARGKIRPDRMFRLNALSRAIESVDADVLPYCHHVKGEFGVPSDFRSKSIIVSTCISAGMLVSLDIGADHFTHIFIDEAAQATEQEAIATFSGVGANANLIVAGDPKQLGPIIASSLARANGMEMSLMEKLMQNESCYARNDDFVTFGNYNPVFVTKLIDNYRSHPALLSVPSRLFYDAELKPCADPAITQSFSRWEGLKNRDCPMIFHSVPGRDEREGNSPSFFNVMEVAQIVAYVKQILEYRTAKVSSKDIGIITPYHKQVQKIRQALAKQLSKDRTFNG